MLVVRNLCRALVVAGRATNLASLVQTNEKNIVSQLSNCSPSMLKWPLHVQNRFQSNSTAKTITVYFIDRDGEKIAAKAKLGTNLLDVAIDNNIDLEGFGACEGTLSCSTCHLILRKEDYDQLKPPNDEENDMLDLAFGLTDTSRLGCQITVEEKMEGWTFVVPKEVSDARK